MDIPAHILDAVHISDESSPPKRFKSTNTTSSRKSSNTPRFVRTYNPHSSAEDISSTSDSEPDHGYQTDFTTPAASDSYPDDMQQPDDVEDFRDREYPQLKGKVYLDHGGTTVRKICRLLTPVCADTCCSSTRSRWSRSFRPT